MINIHDPAVKLEKAAILRQTADRVEGDPGSHSWHYPSRCNCGQVAQTVYLRNGQHVSDVHLMTDRTWALAIADLKEIEDMPVCPATGMPLIAVYAAMASVGFTDRELYRLEYLGDHTRLDYKLTEAFIAFIREWANELEQEALLAQHVSKPLCELVPVGVSV